MNLKTLRKQHSLSQTEMAKILSTSQSNYSKYERGSIELNKDQLITLSNYFHISIDELCDNVKPFQKMSNDRLSQILEEINNLNSDELFAVEAFIKVYKNKWLLYIYQNIYVQFFLSFVMLAKKCFALQFVKIAKSLNAVRT